MDTNDLIVPTQLGTHPKYTSDTRKVKREMIKESLSKRLLEATVPNEVDMNNSIALIDINTGPIDTNTPSNTADTATTNTVVHDECADVSSASAKGTEKASDANDCNNVENTTNNVNDSIDLIDVKTGPIDTNTPSNTADTATTNTVVHDESADMSSALAKSTGSAGDVNNCNNVENTTNNVDMNPDPYTVETNTCVQNDISTDTLPTINEESGNASSEFTQNQDLNPTIPELPIILDKEINISTSGTNENESNTRGMNGKQLLVPPPGETLVVSPTAKAAGGSVSTIFIDNVTKIFPRKKALKNQKGLSNCSGLFCPNVYLYQHYTVQAKAETFNNDKGPFALGKIIQVPNHRKLVDTYKVQYHDVHIKVEKTADGTITMTQPAPMQRILQVLDLSGDNVKMHDTPANTVLFKNKESNQRTQDWNYRSVVRMMMFVVTLTRPDIAFAVHQCAKFNSNPRKCHEETMEQIGRYLRRTHDKGLILKPNDSQQLNCYVYADFAGAYCHQTLHLASSVLSRTGYVLTFSGCPISWVSKMQTKIVLSTTKAEYIALSQSMGDLIPI